jgi:hypothetical protein
MAEPFERLGADERRQVDAILRESHTGIVPQPSRTD